LLAAIKRVMAKAGSAPVDAGTTHSGKLEGVL
jgi:hypothetical protein